MTVQAQANALLLVADMREPLGITGTAQDDLIQELINRASDACETYCQRPLKQQSFSNLRYPGQRGTNLRPHATPIDVLSSIAVTLDGTALTVWRKESDGDPALKDVIVGADVPGEASYLYRACGWLGATPWPIKLSFTGGYDVIPGAVREAATLTVQSFHRHAKNLDPYQSYPASVSGGTVTMRTDTIPRTVYDLLDAYRWRSV